MMRSNRVAFLAFLGIACTVVTAHPMVQSVAPFSRDAELIRAFQTIKESALLSRRPCHVKFGNKCYWGIFRAPSTTNYLNAKLSCEEEGGTLADIYSQGHFDQLVNYARRWTVVKDTLGLWTKMTVDTTNGKLKLSDGTLATKGLWWYSYPLTGLYNSDNKLVYLTVSPTAQGLINGKGESVLFGALCQKIVDG